MAKYQIVITNRFERAYKKLTPAIQSQVDEAIAQLTEDNRPNSLRVKKMRKADVFECSPTKAIRMTFEQDKSEIILRNVGKHDITLNNP